MKRILCFQLIAFICTVCFAQELITIHEDFEQNKFEWDESFSDNGTAVIMNNMLMLENKSETTPMCSMCNLPIISDEDFKASITLSKPKINDKDFIGIVFNYEDELNYWVFLVREKTAYIGRYHDGKYRRVRTNPIILQKGDKNDVLLQLQKRGKNLIFSVDNMEVKNTLLISPTTPLG